MSDSSRHDLNLDSESKAGGSRELERYSPIARTLAVAAAWFTWPLLFVGGLVTTFRVGMAVPDWPTTFGINMFVYDFTNAAWGVFVEHGHRLYGAAVGFCVIGLTICYFVTPQRKLLRILAIIALVGVIAQGVLGGVRVRWNSTDLAFAHGCFGQLFFAFMTMIAVFAGKRWLLMGSQTQEPDQNHIRRWSIGLTGLIYGQIVLGAWLRHHGVGWEWHLGAALAILAAAHMVFWKIRRQRSELPELVGPAWTLTIVLLIQVVLGVVSLWMLWPLDGIAREVTNAQALIRTGHQANGALLLASSSVLALRAWRRLASSENRNWESAS